MTDDNGKPEPKGIACPNCGCRDLRVDYTRPVVNGRRRVRKCRHCGRRVVTNERLA
jgi:transcriptional regulator NrdR family protein